MSGRILARAEVGALLDAHRTHREGLHRPYGEVTDPACPWCRRDGEDPRTHYARVDAAIKAALGVDRCD